ncbi:MAG: hypothetical protein V1726_08485 [Methanobacteriota archaeon]
MRKNKAMTMMAMITVQGISGNVFWYELTSTIWVPMTAKVDNPGDTAV